MGRSKHLTAGGWVSGGAGGHAILFPRAEVLTVSLSRNISVE